MNNLKESLREANMFGMLPNNSRNMNLTKRTLKIFKSSPTEIQNSNYAPLIKSPTCAKNNMLSGLA